MLLIKTYLFVLCYQFLWCSVGDVFICKKAVKPTIIQTTDSNRSNCLDSCDVIQFLRSEYCGKIQYLHSTLRIFTFQVG